MPGRGNSVDYIVLIFYLIWRRKKSVNFTSNFILLHNHYCKCIHSQTLWNLCSVHCEAGARRANCLHQWVHGIRHTTPAWSSLVWNITLRHTLIFSPFLPISVWEFAYEPLQDSWGCLHGSLPHSVRLWQGQDRLRGICMSVSALCSVRVASLSATCRQYTANKWIAKNAKTGNMI